MVDVDVSGGFKECSRLVSDGGWDGWWLGTRSDGDVVVGKGTEVGFSVRGGVGVSCWHHTGMIVRWRHPNA